MITRLDFHNGLQYATPTGPYISISELADQLGCTPDKVMETIDALKRDTEYFRFMQQRLASWGWENLADQVQAAMQADKE
jgi:hypothetical protein